ncbi:hypothetical protein BaRGS_00008508 [Batillaria attramentaria]|uniref:Dolichyl-diphosphooligosaccharide--protein glycosyltransferase subunit DAD1 n=1 Tax=Batillaria attramentaria TaxID=370345 RepID=A0ABD0LLB8_9CAEN
MPESLRSVIVKFYDEYMQTTPKKLKLIDAYLFYVVLTGVIQFAYCCLVGTFPFNSFLAGFISAVGTFVLGESKWLSMRHHLHTQELLFKAVLSGSKMRGGVGGDVLVW